MTRKHFVALAAALAASRPDRGSIAERSAAFAQWCEDREAVASVCAASNPAFARGRFLVATEQEG